MRRLFILLFIFLSCPNWARHGIGQNYYVNASSGNDSNAGTSVGQAWKTIGKLNGASLVAGTAVVNLQGSFNDACLTFGPTNAGSVSSLVVQPYGSGYTITANCSGANAAAITINGVSNVTLQNGKVVGNSGVAMYGVLVENTVGGVMSNITIQGMTVTGFYCGTGVAPCTNSDISSAGAEINVQRFADGDGIISNINILNNTLFGASVTANDDNGILVANSGNIPGYSSPLTVSKVSNITISGNTIYNQGGRAGVQTYSGDGIVLTSVSAGVVQLNVIHDNGANYTHCGGPSGIQVTNFSKNFTLSYNSVYNQQPVPYTAGCDWDAYDADVGSGNVIYEYNYAFNIFGVCGLLYQPGSGSRVFAGNIYRYNVFEQCGQIPTQTNFGINIASDNSIASADVYNNTVYSTTGILMHVADVGTMTGLVSNNILYGNGSGQTLFNNDGNPHTAMTILNNDYYQANVSGFKVFWVTTTYTSLASWQAAGGDANGVTTNPSLTTPGGGGACSVVAIPNTCPSAYRLQTGSPMIGTGLNLTSGPYNRVVGAIDFYGHTIPNGVSTGYNFGADGGNP